MTDLRHIPRLWALLFAVSIPFVTSLAEKETVQRNRSIQGINGAPHVLPFNINRMQAFYWDDGDLESGSLIYPKGTAYAIGPSVIRWGGIFHDGRTPPLRAQGGWLNRGSILGIRTGLREDPNSAGVRNYRIRRDFRRADLRQDAADTYGKAVADVTNADMARLKSDYGREWSEWPWQKGAPFDDRGYVGPDGTSILGANNDMLDWGEDINRNHYLDPGEDVNHNGKLDGETPGIPDADQVLWFSCNDVGRSMSSGMEVQMTIWGYNRNDALGNIIFKRYRLIYKGLLDTSPDAWIDSMYFTQQTYGTSSGKYAGCDTLLNLGFAYSSGPEGKYTAFGIAPPAIGTDFMQGPCVRGIAGQDRNKNGIDDAQDNAIYNFRQVGPGFINLPLTAFVYGDNPPRGAPRYSLPRVGGVTGSIQWYQVMRGLPPIPVGPPDPPALRNPITGQPSPLWSSGDP
ncbi:MAG: hypothetical protein AAB393_05725, partial [Bacteroidota bacterium]